MTNVPYSHKIVIIGEMGYGVYMGTLYYKSKTKQKKMFI